VEADEARWLVARSHAGSDLRRLSFDGLQLTSLQFPGQSWFDRCSFVGTDFRQATLDGTRFKMCDLRSANLRGASLRHVRFGGCDLRDADLRGADLTGADFGYVNSGTDAIGRTDVTGVDLRGATLTEVTRQRVVGWPDEQ
jgi:uncharacterized protein YjbI with pentapeptide repeats